jgi:hypothetical protein
MLSAGTPIKDDVKFLTPSLRPLFNYQQIPMLTHQRQHTVAHIRVDQTAVLFDLFFVGTVTHPGH